MSSKTQKSSVEPYMKWQEGNPKEAQFGILSKLSGTWVNWKGGPKGLHTTPMPSPGTSSETVFGVFHFKAQEYREQLKFTKVNSPQRNRGGSNEQFNGAVKYETAILDNDGALQHFENGMYIWMGDNQMPWDQSPYQSPPNMFSHASTKESVNVDAAEPVFGPGVLGPQFVPPHSISRQGVIPHGTTIHLTGNIIGKPNTSGKEPHIANLWEQQYLSVSPTMGIKPSEDLGTDRKNPRKKPDWTLLPREKQLPDGVNSGRAYFLKIFNYDQFGAKYPYTVQPNLKLSDFNKSLKFISYDTIELDSYHPTGIQGGIINNAMIERYCRVVRMRMRLWIEKVEENGRTFDQLQYEQIVFFEFMFGSNGDTTQWPHIQVNTLRREEDIAPGEKFAPIQLPTDDAVEETNGHCSGYCAKKPDPKPFTVKGALLGVTENILYGRADVDGMENR